MVHTALQRLRKFATNASGEIQVEIAALSTGVSATIYIVLKTLFGALS